MSAYGALLARRPSLVANVAVPALRIGSFHLSALGNEPTHDDDLPFDVELRVIVDPELLRADPVAGEDDVASHFGRWSNTPPGRRSRSERELTDLERGLLVDFDARWSPRTIAGIHRRLPPGESPSSW